MVSVPGPVIMFWGRYFIFGYLDPEVWKASGWAKAVYCQRVNGQAGIPDENGHIIDGIHTSGIAGPF